LFFLIGFLFYVWTYLDYDPPIYTSSTAGVTGTCHHRPFLLIEMYPLNLLWRSLALKHDPPDFCLPSIYNYSYHPLSFSCCFVFAYLWERSLSLVESAFLGENTYSRDLNEFGYFSRTSLTCCQNSSIIQTMLHILS
jgi:hypothetical protein